MILAIFENYSKEYWGDDQPPLWLVAVATRHFQKKYSPDDLTRSLWGDEMLI